MVEHLAGVPNAGRQDRFTRRARDALGSRILSDADMSRHISERGMKAHTRKRKILTPDHSVVRARHHGRSVPRPHAAEQRPKMLPADRRITLEPHASRRRFQHVKIWTPSETLPLLRDQDKPGGRAGADDRRATGIPFRHSPPVPSPRPFVSSSRSPVSRSKPHPDVIAQPDHRRRQRRADRQPRRSTGCSRASSLNHKFKDASTVVIEIRLDSVRR